MRQAILAASFGTSVPQARQGITCVEQALAAAAPGWDFATAFTSPTIRRILAKRGEPVDSLEQALDKLAGRGYDRVIVQPTHLLYGIEYDKIKQTVEAFAPRFPALLFGKPLLADDADLRALAAVAWQALAPQRGALVLLGHGTPHFANMVYPAMQTALRLAGVDNAFVGTVEGWPGFDEVLAQLQAAHVAEVTLAPLLLVAGEHACSDMAGDGPQSWKGRLQAAGFAVDCKLQGLGCLPGVQQLYASHLRELL